jgi:hypothetical protein
MVDTISTVRHQLNDLKNHVRPPADRVERVENIKDDPFTNALHAVLRKIQDSIKPELEKLVDAKQIPLKKVIFLLYFLL